MICSYFLASIFCFQLQVNLVCVRPIYNQKATFTAYTLSPEETDSEPCIGAGNHNLCEIRGKEPNKCIIATRKLKLHTKIIIEGYPENQECEVLDRTSKEHADKIDILMYTRKEAINFGKKELNYKILD